MSESSCPVIVELTPPARYERVQLLLRLALAVAVGYVGLSLGWLIGALYLGLPVFAAVAVSARGGERYLSDTAPSVVRVLRWVVAFYAYMMLLGDRFPAGEPYQDVRVQIHPTGHATPGSALLRLLAGFPAALVLCVLAFVGGLVWLIAALGILFRESYPLALYGYQRGVLRLQARLLAYLASVVDEYPRLSFDTGPDDAGMTTPEGPLGHSSDAGTSSTPA